MAKWGDGLPSRGMGGKVGGWVAKWGDGMQSRGMGG